MNTSGENQRHPDLEPAHPGEFLAEMVLPATGRTETQIAGLLGVSRRTLHEVLRARQGVTPALAVRLGKLFGNGPQLWLAMQQAHDLRHAERALKNEIAAMPTLRAA